MTKNTESLEDQSVGDLRERAKAAGIAGAGKLPKDELVKALRGTEGKAGMKAASGSQKSADAVTLLKEDHKKVKALFKKALEKESGDASLAGLAKEIIAELELHTAVEEKLLYPALKAKAVAKDDDDAKDEVLEAYVEHDSVKELIAKIKASSPRDESYKALVQVMSEQVDHHVEEEESEMFKQAKKLLGQSGLEELGQQITAMKAAAKSS